CPSGVGVSRRSQALQADCSATKSPTPPLSLCKARVSPPQGGLCPSGVGVSRRSKAPSFFA
ncbi:MAG: hypothetical protein FWF76_02930, partial [Oscillospiraceae bacterium]|nr:hypothetical protein [Oscillospiraceae bacterium]